MTCIPRDPNNFDLIYHNYVALLADTDALRARVEELESQKGGYARDWDCCRTSLETILAFADGMLFAQNAINTPDDAPERKVALWLHTEITSALTNLE